MIVPTTVWEAAENRWAISFNVTGFSSFNISTSPVGLPIKLGNIYAKPTGNSNTIFWNTITEKDNSRFEVLRSVDGRSFEKIEQVNTKAINGNSNTSLMYNFEDVNPIASKLYYKLNIVDKTGN